MGFCRGKSRDILFLVLASLLWSMGGILLKLVQLNPIALAGIRSLISAGVILIYLRKPKINWSLPQVGAAAAYAAMVIAFVAANKMTTAANAILLQYTAPIFVAILSYWLLSEKISWKDWLTIGAVGAGMVLFFLDNIGAGGMAGNLLAIFSGICYAFFTIFMRKQKNGSPLESVFLGNLFTAIIGVPFMLGSSVDTKGWIGIIILGVLQLGVPYILFAKAIKNVRAMEAVLISVIEPILNPVWVFLVAGELPGAWAILGGGVVLISITARCASSTIEAEQKHKVLETHAQGLDSLE